MFYNLLYSTNTNTHMHKDDQVLIPGDWAGYVLAARSGAGPAEPPEATRLEDVLEK